ncbi:MAG: VCBS repeat-containing protein, partial [Cellvibrionales bacterium]|nr:VCBS repeat-containing protein [Cellvibrionales bacterium]
PQYQIQTPPTPRKAPTPDHPATSDRIGTLAGNFRVNELGQAHYQIPIHTAAGTAGVKPELGLSYRSTAQNGWLGQGWSLSGLAAISRCRQTRAQDNRDQAIHWGKTDRFCYNGQRLLLVTGREYGAPNSTYKTELDSFQIFTAQGGTTGHPAYFTATAKDGSTRWFGNTPDSRQRGPTASSTLAWALNEFQDSVGNPIKYRYHNDTAGQRIQRISYAYGSTTAPAATIDFLYQTSTRPDVQRHYIAGQLLRKTRLLSKIIAKNGPNVLREYRLQYAPIDRHTPAPHTSRLTRIQECTSGNICLPATQFAWDQTEPGFNLRPDTSGQATLAGDHRYLLNFKSIDINGDGNLDLMVLGGYHHVSVKKRFLRRPKTTVTSHQTLYSFINSGTGKLTLASQWAYPNNIENQLEMAVIDYNADGRQDLMVHDHSSWHLYLSQAQGAGLWRLTRQSTRFPFASAAVVFGDLNSDGLVDALAGNSYYLLQRDTSKTAASSTPYAYSAKKNMRVEAKFCETTMHGYEPFWGHFSYTESVPCTPQAERIAGDLNGDGIADYLVSNDRAHKLNTAHWLEDGTLARRDYPFPKQLRDEEHLHFADFNADGLTDLLAWTEQKWWAALNNGRGFNPPQQIKSSPTETAARADRVQLADINHDGFPDLVFHQKSSDTRATLKVHYWRNTSGQFSSPEPLPTLTSSLTVNDKNFHILLDVTGDGQVDYTHFASTQSQLSVRTRNALSSDRSDRITQITNGLGAITAIEYDRINRQTANATPHYRPATPAVTSQRSGSASHAYRNDYSALNAPFAHLNGEHRLQGPGHRPVIPINGPVYMVKRIRGSAPTAADPNATSSIAYYYSDARIQAGRGSLGYRTLTSVDEQTGVRTTTEYRQDWPFIGMPWKTETRTAAGTRIGYAENSWRLYGYRSSWPTTAQQNGSAKLGPLQVLLHRSTEHDYDLSGQLLAKNTLTTRKDAHGNALQVTALTTAPNGSPLLQVDTTNTYGTTAYARQYGRLSRTSVRHTRDTQTRTRTSSYSYHPSGPHRGMLQTETLEPDNPAYRRTTTHHYDRWGNPTHTTTRARASTDHGTQTRHSDKHTYDPRGRHIQTTHRHHPGHGYRSLSTVEQRDKYGSAEQILDHRGNRHYSRHSPMGHKYHQTRDSGGGTHSYRARQDSHCPAHTAYVQITKQHAGGTQKTCHDRLARPIRHLKTGFDGRPIATDTHHDSLGRITQKTIPYYLGQQRPLAAHTRYDLLGRPTATTAPDGSRTQIRYHRLSTTTTNALGRSRTETRNALGELTQVTDQNGHRTTYHYDAHGNLTQLQDPAGNRILTAFDLYGRKTKMQDPNKGTWHYRHNAFGELITQTDAKGQTSTHTYDSRGRLIQRTDRHADGTTATTAHWHYAHAGPAADQLQQVQDSHGYQKTHQYDQHGRPHQTTWTLPDIGSFTERQTYDQHGRPFQHFDAASDQQSNGKRGTQTHYNAHGYAHELVDVRHHQGQPLTRYRQITQMNAADQITAHQLGNGITTHHDHDPATGHLTRLHSRTALGESRQNLYYEWDPVGNLTQRSDQSGP